MPYKGVSCMASVYWNRLLFKLLTQTKYVYELNWSSCTVSRILFQSVSIYLAPALPEPLTTPSCVGSYNSLRHGPGEGGTSSNVFKRFLQSYWYLARLLSLKPNIVWRVMTVQKDFCRVCRRAAINNGPNTLRQRARGWSAAFWNNTNYSFFLKEFNTCF